MMRLLIGYDGSRCSDAAVGELACAGLPEVGRALVLTAADVAHPGIADRDMPRIAAERAARDASLACAREIADRGAALARAVLPGWCVAAEVVQGKACDALVERAMDWRAELVSVGSHGRAGIRRLVLGSVAEHVVRHAPCSVRVGRCAERAVPQGGAAPRLLLAVDGSVGSDAACQAIAGRCWPAGTVVEALAVVDTRILLMAGQCPMVDLPPLGEAAMQGSCEALAASAAATQLRRAGLSARARVYPGDPAQVLIAEARDRGVDCIFIGANGARRLERTLLGGIASQVAAHAPCSVEVARPPRADAIGHPVADAAIAQTPSFPA